MKKWDSKSKKFDKNNKEILTIFEGKYGTRFENNYPFEEFKELFDQDKCGYCDIQESDIARLTQMGKIYKKHHRGSSLEIDRRKPNDEYTKDNCVRCCYWCNNAKTDEFSEIEFVSIAEKIREVWGRRGIERLMIAAKKEHLSI